MQIQRCKKTTCFRKRFFVLRGWNRIGHDARASVEISHALPADRGADEDAQLALVIESQIAERSGVRPARDRFEVIDDFHRADFWSAGDASAGETSGQRPEMGDA